MNQQVETLAIVGGGASGFFTAINAAEEAIAQNKQVKIVIFELAVHYLKKVQISGGGRCNVTHHQFDPIVFSQNYPRGQRELKSPFTQFQAKDTVQWFQNHGVRLVVESDGRMFPSTNKSDTIINCFVKYAQKYNIQVLTKNAVKKIDMAGTKKFQLTLKDESNFECNQVVIATGSSETGYQFAIRLGHTITQRAPSLFSFKINHDLLKDLPGTSFENIIVKLTLPNKKKFVQQGPALITHWGLSGPAILKMSAWAARELKQSNYQGTLTVNWSGVTDQRQVEQILNVTQRQYSKMLVKNSPPLNFTKRFWSSLLNVLDIAQDKRWGEISKKDFSRLLANIHAMSLSIHGKNRFKDEFVECGGVKLSEINLKTMESKIVSGLYFTGEILDIDGITGGFNFQNAWTSGYIAGKSLISNID